MNDLKTIQAYETSDGTIFKDLIDAEFEKRGE